MANYIGNGVVSAMILTVIGLAVTGPIKDGVENSKNESTQNFLNDYYRTDDYAVERSYWPSGDMDCSDFSSQSEAQDFFESEGGPDEDYHNLDRDGDGIACESL